MEEKEYGIQKAGMRRGLDASFLVLETEGEYREDYQMRMLQENSIPGLMAVSGRGEERNRIYEYEVSGKTALKTKYKENKISMKDMKKFIGDLSEVVRAVREHLLNPDHLLLDPAYVFWEEDRFWFCYYPAGSRNIWEAFHEMTEQFVCWTDYEDMNSVRTSFLLHKETMKENYSLYKIRRQVEELEEEETETQPEEEAEQENFYDSAQHDWIARQERGSSIMQETENMWKPVRNFLRRHKKPGWRQWDGIYIDEEEL